MLNAPVRILSICACSAILLALASPAVAQPTRKVSIDTEPRGASVYIDDKEAGVAGITPVVLELPVGETIVIIELEHFTPRFETILVPKGKGKPIKVIYDLERGAGTLVIQTDASSKGARVRIDDEDRGLAPARLEVPAGGHHVEVIAKGKTVYDDTVDVEVGAESNVNVNVKTARSASARGATRGARRERHEDGADDPDADARPSGDEGERIATRAEDDDDEARDLDDDDELGGGSVRKRTTTPSMPMVRVAPMFEVGYRSLDYSKIGSIENTPALRQRGNLLFGARVEVFPVRALPNLMLSAQGGYSVPQTLNSSQGEIRVLWWRADVAATYRIDLSSQLGIVALVGYARTRHKFDGQAAAFSLVPDATYSLVRLGAGLRGRFDWFEVTGMIENRPVLDGGVFADRFRTASADGLAARLTAMAHLGDRYFARVDGNYARYAWSFGYDPTDTYRAGGAIVVVSGFSLSAGAAF